MARCALAECQVVERAEKEENGTMSKAKFSTNKMSIIVGPD
jgi:hypothetical protein